MARRRHRKGLGAAARCAGRKANGAIKKGYTLKRGHSCPVKA